MLLCEALRRLVVFLTDVPSTHRYRPSYHGRQILGGRGHVPLCFGNAPIDFRFLHSKIFMEVAMSPYTRVKIDAYASYKFMTSFV